MTNYVEHEIALSRTNWLTSIKANKDEVSKKPFAKPTKVRVLQEVTPEMSGNTERMRERLRCNPYNMVSLPYP